MLMQIKGLIFGTHENVNEIDKSNVILYKFSDWVLPSIRRWMRYKNVFPCHFLQEKNHSLTHKYVFVSAFGV